jgi:hypothetical protein
MSSERQGQHPARSYGATGGGFAEGKASPEQFPEDQQVESFAAGTEDADTFPEDERLGSFARGQEETDSPQNVEEGTFGTTADQATDG